MTSNKQKQAENQPLRALGLMSGTSLDGVDAAIIETDGVTVRSFGPVRSVPYEAGFRGRLRDLLGKKTAGADIIADFTAAQAEAALTLLAENNLTPADIDVIGFHGQTIFHDPAGRLTVQIGDGAMMAELTGVDTVAEFRHADVAAGGEGAPFASLYHRALATDLGGPLAVLNLGGVGNVTYIDGETVLAFDTGPANALMDDWILRHSSNDRGCSSAGRGWEEGAATLLRFTVESIRRALDHLPDKPKRWLLTGGGRKNPELVRYIAEVVDAPAEPVEAVGWRGDDLEAEAFAFLAVRSLRGLPLSLPTTTGVPEPMTGGVLYPAPSQKRESARG